MKLTFIKGFSQKIFMEFINYSKINAKNALKKIAVLSLVIFLLLPVVSAQENNSLEIDFFYSLTCPHCISEKSFLESIEENYENVYFNYYKVDDEKNFENLMQLYEKYEVPHNMRGVVPITFIGEDYFIGFDDSMKLKIENSIKSQITGEEFDSKNGLIKGINPDEHSLFALAIILGFIDGFNICSLGAIMLILSMVLVFKSKKIILIIGGLFLIVTAFVYLLLVYFWHQIFMLLVPWESLMQLLLSMLMLFAGIYFFKEFLRFAKHGPTCQSAQNKFYNRAVGWFQKKIEAQKEKPNIVALIGAVCIFALLVTIIEFPCSAVLPLIFSGILAQANLPPLVSLFYIFLYVFVYLIDEIIIFLVAVFTMNLWSTSPKLIKIIYLIASASLIAMSIYYFSSFI